MKTIIAILTFSALLVLSVTTSAGETVDVGTVSSLPYPWSPVTLSMNGETQVCTGIGFNADDSVYGTCEIIKYGATSGRGGHAVPYTAWFYLTNWSTSGQVTVGALCMIVKTGAGATITYEPGYSAATCNNTVNPLGGPLVPIDGLWAWYVATSADGLYELIHSGGQSYVVTL